MESLTLQVDGPITGRAYKRGGGGGAYKRDFTVPWKGYYLACKYSHPSPLQPLGASGGRECPKRPDRWEVAVFAR